MSGVPGDWLASYYDVIEARIFIGSTENDLPAEIRTNMWGIALSEQECGYLTTADLLDLLTKVIENRRQQLDQANSDHGMIFYLWFDEQALQLRFNLISDFHKRLPFACQLNILMTPQPILDRYLRYPYHETMPRDALHEVAEVSGGPDTQEPVVLDVTLLRLSAQHETRLW
jgi:hypothetical protein